MYFRYTAMYFRDTSTGKPEINVTITTGSVAGYDSVWFIAVLAGLIITMTVTSLIAAAMTSLFLNTAGRRTYNKMFDVVLRAPMYFFETKPSW